MTSDALRRLPYDVLVERVISAEAQNRVYERVLRELGELEGDRSLGALVVLYQARLAQCEANVQRLTSRRKAG